MNDARSAAYGAFVLRVALGILFIAHGLLKLIVFTLPGTVEFFRSVGLPGWLAYVVTFAELAGGAALVLGFHARYVALALTPILVGAIVTVHGANGWLFDNKGGGWEFPAFWAVALFAQFLLGNGALALSVDKAATAK